MHVCRTSDVIYKPVEGLIELLVKDNYFFSQSREIQVFLREAGKQSLNDIIKRCENYREKLMVFMVMNRLFMTREN